MHINYDSFSIKIIKPPRALKEEDPRVENQCRRGSCGRCHRRSLSYTGGDTGADAAKVPRASLSAHQASVPRHVIPPHSCARLAFRESSRTLCEFRLHRLQISLRYARCVLRTTVTPTSITSRGKRLKW